jgi:parvulin-like peptidyl-prolyl isomerase
MNSAKVDDQAIQAFYDQHKADYEQVKAQHILIRFKGSQGAVKEGAKELTEDEAKAKAEDIRKKLQGGADFAELAKKESDDSTNADKGGELPPFGRHAMQPAFEQAAFSQPIGEIGEPVKTVYGFHIIKVESRGDKPLSEVRAEIQRRLPAEQAQKAMEELRTSAKVEMDPEYFPPAPPAMAPPSLKPATPPNATPQTPPPAKQ